MVKGVLGVVCTKGFVGFNIVNNFYKKKIIRFYLTPFILLSSPVAKPALTGVLKLVLTSPVISWIC
jgi:hypothetical protein